MLEKILFTIPVKGSKAQLYSSGASTMVFSSRERDWIPLYLQQGQVESHIQGRRGRVNGWKITKRISQR